MIIPEIKTESSIHTEIDITEKEQAVFVCNIKFELTSGKEAVGFSQISWGFPYLDCAGIWYPNCGFNRSVNADWAGYNSCMTTCSAPIMTVFSEDGRNRFTIAVSEVKETVGMKAGLHEEDGTILFQIKIPNTYVRQSKKYELSVLMDQRNVLFYEAISYVSRWWEKDCKLIPIVPDASTRKPVYSTWYSYHQNITDDLIEKECKMASELGFETLILDDGWQTDDNNRGYAFCGDWEVSEKRFPNFKAHVQKIHNFGMKYMVWYSVPFLGCKSKHWERFKNKILFYDEELKAGVLDPRYPEARNYLVETYVNAIKEWDIDGFKLDFIDEIMEKKDSPACQESMDFQSVQQALDFMMTQIYEAISKEKPDIMVEFRQRYIGPNMRKYGNMFRVSDCPNSAIRNRVGTVDLRMLSGLTTVHSDPLMWHKDEAPELAALQIISSIFATVQISVKLADSTEEMMKMLRFWVGFMKQNQELLQKYQIRPQEPQNLYPVVWSLSEEQGVGAIYTENRVMGLPSEVSDYIILNGTKANAIALKAEREGAYEFVVKDCMGEVVQKFAYKGKLELFTVSVPIAGQIYISRKL